MSAIEQAYQIIDNLLMAELEGVSVTVCDTYEERVVICTSTH